MHVPATGADQASLEHRSNPAVIVLCMVVTVIEGYNLIVFGSVVPLLLDDPSLGVTPQSIGTVGGLVYIGAVLGALLAPLLAERLGRKQVLMAAILVFAGGALLTGLAESAGVLGAARFLAGLGVGGALTTAMTVARNSASSRRASLVVTITMAGIPLGGVVAALLAVPVLPAFGWRPMFFVGAAMAAAIAVAVALMTIPTDSPQEVAGRGWTTAQKLRSVLTGRGLVVAVLVAVCAIGNMVAWQGLNVWAAEAMVQLGFSLRAALLFTFVLTGAAVIGSFATAWSADRTGPARTAVVTGTCTLLGLLGMAFLPTGVAVALVCIALMGIGGHSTMNLVHTTTSNIFPLPARATALGWSNSTSFIGAFLGPTIGGAAIATGGSTGLFSTYAVAAAVTLAGLVGLMLADRVSHHGHFSAPAETLEPAPAAAAL
ncbi:MFS transporter [Nocardioides bruguierae]|uniref:MFS transporter n=1 Tax=Nocardioides bruguierae TaxID=2945102 RepID=A0A9X2D940_9ACTN|nr:MFS transporter [Nocardioides bruguierae]MCM0621421.1 MFS transporter [Nocardioides bruguierae]